MGGVSLLHGKHSDTPAWASLQRGTRGLRKVCGGLHVSKFFCISSEKGNMPGAQDRGEL